MADKSKIEWTEATWNPIRARNLKTGGVGHFCEKVSPGCAGCYAERMQPRFKNDIRYNAADGDKVEVFLDEDVLTQPLRWSRPRMIFPCSMTDLFGSWVPDEWIDRIFAVMALARQHTFQLLTKRAERLPTYCSDRSLPGRLALKMGVIASGNRPLMEKGDEITREWAAFNFHLPNVWLGVSCEDQKTADERIPMLLQTPAAVRWVSAEPLLGPIDFTNLALIRHDDGFADVSLNCLTGHVVGPDDMTDMKLDWMVVGGESGPKARPFDIQWARDIIAQCKAADVPVFVKQLGANPYESMDRDIGLPLNLESRKGGDMLEWSEDLHVRQTPEVANG